MKRWGVRRVEIHKPGDRTKADVVHSLCADLQFLIIQNKNTTKVLNSNFLQRVEMQVHLLRAMSVSFFYIRPWTSVSSQLSFCPFPCFHPSQSDALTREFCKSKADFDTRTYTYIGNTQGLSLLCEANDGEMLIGTRYLVWSETRSLQKSSNSAVHVCLAVVRSVKDETHKLSVEIRCAHTAY